MSRPVQIVSVRDVDDEGLAAYRAPRHDVVEEEAVGIGAFRMRTGPFTNYHRDIEVETRGPGDHTVTQRVEFSLGVSVWSVLFVWPMRRVLRGPGRGAPWWAPPQVLDTQSATTLASLAFLSVVAGFLGTVTSQTLTYVADEFGADNGDQANTLAGIRIGVVLALGVAAWADRNGRRRALLFSAIGACIATGAAALSPGLVVFGFTQIVARGLGTALTLLIVVVVTEEMPAGSRAYGASLLTMSGGLGGGVVLFMLPVVEVDERAWRLIYGFALVFLPLVWVAARLLPESRRFVRRHAIVGFAGHGRRLALLAGTSLALAVFSTPASQLQNQFLREEYDFGAGHLTAFTILTVMPASAGIVLGGRLADQWSKRMVGAIGIGGGALFLAVQYVIPSVELVWVVATLGSTLGGLAVPALSVYGPELFPTALRSRANVIITILGVTGSVVGLVVVGWLGDRWSLGPAIAVLAVFPALATVLLIPRYPETAHRELEDLNPEDDLAASTADPSADSALI